MNWRVSMGFQREAGDWKKYRSRFNLARDDEVDLHRGKRDRFTMSYDDAMAAVAETVRNALQDAQVRRRPYVMFRHGSSTSRNGATTARSEVRKFMRSPEATPYIDRRLCIQHDSVFVAKIRY
jgi:hypothetical protein